MHKLISRHSLVVGVGPCDETRRSSLLSHFPDYEIVSSRQIYHELFGDSSRNDMNSVVFAELKRRVALKLDLGERVVVDAPNLRREDRFGFARHGVEVGVPIFYAITDAPEDDKRLEHVERDIFRGDGMADVVDLRHETPIVVPRQPVEPDTWKGITVIADVHGRLQPLLAAIGWAKARGHYIVFLGDILDYGPDSLETVEEVYRLVMRGEAELVLGNHERKIMRWIEDPDRQRLSDGNRVTTDAIENLGPRARKRWIGRFRGLYHHGHHLRRFRNIVMTHAAVHPNYWTGTASRRDLNLWAMFGEFIRDDSGDFSRRYGWTEKVPADATVIVGHDIRSTEKPMTLTSDLGGKTIFLDTGSGKGGRLSSVDLFLRDETYRIENFNMY